MALKAAGQITLSAVVDIAKTTRYYSLQSSTLAKPSKPTANPPSGWVTAEPAYTAGATNSLYACDLTSFSDSTWSYSDVSLSSSYEAAKDAYNKAVAAAKTATDYVNFGAGGIVVGDMTSGVLKGNVLVDSDSVDIRNGSTILSRFSEKLIELGVNTTDSSIKFCGGKGTIEYSQTTPMGEKISGINIYTEGSDGVNIYAKGPGGMRLVSNASNLKKHGAISIGEQYVSIGVGDGVSEELGSGAYILMGTGVIHMRGYCPYEVGDILQTSDAKCATLAGVQARYPGTKWEQITNRFLYGSTSSGVTGGAASVTLRADHLPPGTLTNTWGLGPKNEAQVANGPFYYYYNYSAQNDVPIMPPYVTVYMWRRIS